MKISDPSSPACSAPLRDKSLVWETKKLGEVCEIERGGSSRPIQNFITTSKMTLITPQLPTMHRITPIRHMTCPRDLGARGRMGNPRPLAALDAESEEVLGNIKALL